MIQKTIEASHQNGLHGKLIGDNEMSIYNLKNKELFHTSFRLPEIQTKDDLYEVLDIFPTYVRSTGEEKERLFERFVNV